MPKDREGLARRAGRRAAGGGVTALVLAALLGCSSPTLNPKDLEGSARRVRNSVDASRRAAFDEALALVQQASRGEAPGTKAFSLEGMDAEAVFTEAQRIDIRREIAWHEELVRDNQELLDTAERLALFEVVDAQEVRGRQDQVRLLLTVRNRLDWPVHAGWMNTEVRVVDGRPITSLDYVVFTPPVPAGAAGTTETLVSGEAGPYVTEVARDRVSFRFSTLERGGRVVLEAPTPEMEAKAKSGLDEAKAQIAELRAKLAAMR